MAEHPSRLVRCDVGSEIIRIGGRLVLLARDFEPAVDSVNRGESIEHISIPGAEPPDENRHPIRCEHRDGFRGIEPMQSLAIDSAYLLDHGTLCELADPWSRGKDQLIGTVRCPVGMDRHPTVRHINVVHPLHALNAGPMTRCQIKLSGDGNLGSNKPAARFVVAAMLLSKVELGKSSARRFRGEDLVFDPIGSGCTHCRGKKVVDPMLDGFA